MLRNKNLLLLDMNSTFMFGEDRFADDEDFSIHYASLGGRLPATELNRIVRAAYDDLALLYPDPAYHECFPSLASAIHKVTANRLAQAEVERIVATFAHHELGHIPTDYAQALHALHQRFRLAAIVDIWAPKDAWLSTFEQAGIAHLFSATWFSSDHGIVKPSAKPFEAVLQQLNASRAESIMIGDSVRRDLGGASNAGIDCILVGGAQDPRAVACIESLLLLGAEE